MQRIPMCTAYVHLSDVNFSSCLLVTVVVTALLVSSRSHIFVVCIPITFSREMHCCSLSEHILDEFLSFHVLRFIDCNWMDPDQLGKAQDQQRVQWTVHCTVHDLSRFRQAGLVRVHKIQASVQLSYSVLDKGPHICIIARATINTPRLC